MARSLGRSVSPAAAACYVRSLLTVAALAGCGTQAGRYTRALALKKRASTLAQFVRARRRMDAQLGRLPRRELVGRSRAFALCACRCLHRLCIGFWLAAFRRRDYGVGLCMVADHDPKLPSAARFIFSNHLAENTWRPRHDSSLAY